MGGSPLRPRLANRRPGAATGYSRTPEGTFAPVPAKVYAIPATSVWLFRARASKSGARITGTALAGIAAVAGQGNRLAPAAVAAKIFWVVFWLIGPSAVALLGPGSSGAFVAAARS
jgi:hypothetical protein